MVNRSRGIKEIDSFSNCTNGIYWNIVNETLLDASIYLFYITKFRLETFLFSMIEILDFKSLSNTKKNQNKASMIVSLSGEFMGINYNN